MATEANHPINVLESQDGASTNCRAVLALEGMTCASCAMRIEKGLKKVPGVRDASVNFATEQATVTYDSEQTGLEQMIQKVDAIGYKARPLISPASHSTQVEVAPGVSNEEITLSAVAHADEQSRVMDWPDATRLASAEIALRCCSISRR